MSDEWIIGSMRADDRLMQQVHVYSRLEPPPSKIQVAAVLHALADHTALCQAVTWRPDPDPVGPPEATSVGRWLHDLGDYLEGCWSKRIARST